MYLSPALHLAVAEERRREFEARAARFALLDAAGRSGRARRPIGPGLVPDWLRRQRPSRAAETPGVARTPVVDVPIA